MEPMLLENWGQGGGSADEKQFKVRIVKKEATQWRQRLLMGFRIRKEEKRKTRI